MEDLYREQAESIINKLKGPFCMSQNDCVKVFVSGLCQLVKEKETILDILTTVGLDDPEKEVFDYCEILRDFYVE